LVVYKMADWLAERFVDSFVNLKVACVCGWFRCLGQCLFRYLVR
jgi:hypothetical protein